MARLDQFGRALRRIEVGQDTHFELTAQASRFALSVAPEIPEADEGFLDDDFLLFDSAALVESDGTLGDTSPPVQRTARDLLFTSASAGDLALWTGEAATTTPTPVRTADPPAENTVQLTRRRGSGGTPAIAVVENLQSPVLG